MVKEVTSCVYEVDTRYKAAKAFLIVEDAITLIDTGLKGSEKHLQKAIEGLGRHLTDVAQIIVTHCHVDHAGSAARLKANIL